MSYILFIIVVTYQGLHSNQIEYNSKETCINAKYKVVKEYKKIVTGKIVAVCTKIQ